MTEYGAKGIKAESEILAAFEVIEEKVKLIKKLSFDEYERNRLHVLDYDRLEEVRYWLNEVRLILANG